MHYFGSAFSFTVHHLRQPFIILTKKSVEIFCVLQKNTYICKVIKNEKREIMKAAERFIVKEVVKFGMLFGYVVYDTVEKKNTCFEYGEDDKHLAKAKADLKNALSKSC